MNHFICQLEKNFKLAFFFSIFLFGAGCTSVPTSNSTSPTPMEKGVLFSIYVNEKPIEGATVNYAKFEGKTNAEGSCHLEKIPNKLINKEGTVSIIHSRYHIDTTIMLRIKNRTDIYLRYLIGDQYTVGDIAGQDMEELGNIQIDLDNAKILLDDAESKLRDYLAKYPDSAIDDYLTANKKLRNQLASLTEYASRILTEYDDVVEKLKEGDIVDINKHNRMAQNISAQVAKFVKKQNSFQTEQQVILDAQLEKEINTDIFFDLGRYKIGTIPMEGQNRIEAFINQINIVRGGVFKDLPDEALRCKITAIGYTDGFPVGEPLEQEIKPLCQSTSASTQDLNDCLSHLRAEEVAAYLKARIALDNTEIKSSGRGSALALDDKPRSSLRKCVLSVSIIKVEYFSHDD